MSNNLKKSRVILVGTGPMAEDYAAVLKHLDINLVVVGRGVESAERFELKTGVKPFTGGLDKFLSENSLNESDYVIVAVGTEMLMPILQLLKKQTFNKVLIEKPGAVSIDELLENQNSLEIIESKVFIAYNRRFYSSVMETQRLIEEDGGLKSMHFEFTEWAHKIEPLKKAEGVKENWFFANSTHIVDLAFFIAGKPVDWKAFSKKGDLNWHPKTNFSGAGITERGVVFSYISNWESAGRWGIELMTNKRRIYLKPVEEIGIQVKGTINIESYQIPENMDSDFKPGLFEQVNAFLGKGDNEKFVSLREQINNSNHIYSKILNG